MKQTKLALVALAATLALTLTARAAEEKALHEIEGASNAVLSFASGSDTAFQVDAGYSYLLVGDWLQGAVIASFLTHGGTTDLGLVVGPTLNYSLDNGGFEDSFYLTPAIGFQYSNFGGSSTNLAHRIEAGKRFAIIPHVEWKPAFIASGVNTTGSVEQFRIVPAQFAFSF